MKTSVLKWTSVVFALMIFGLVHESQAHSRVNISIFYSALAPYGEWIDYRDYGLCWRPTVVEAGWRPYTHGRWVWTEYGWTWASDFDWGWAPFHYGRWLYDNYYGWIWVPDDVWGPAWVDWRFSDSYIGWAPLPPAAHFQIGIGLSFGNYNIQHFAWSFTNCSGFLGPRLVILPFHQNIVLIRGTRRIDGIGFRGNRIYNAGPRVGFVEHATGSRVRRSVIVDSRDFGGRRGSLVDGDRVYLRRPNFERPREDRSRDDMERGGRSGYKERRRFEGRSDQRQGWTGERENRFYDFGGHERDKHSAPDLRGRGEAKRELRAPERSDRERQQRSERHSRRR